MGSRTIRLTLPEAALAPDDDLRSIPGIRVRGSTLVASADLAEVLRRRGLSPIVGVAKGEKAEAIVSDRFFPWQRDGAAALIAGEKAGLWFACGLGKSATALAAMAAVAPEGPCLAITRAMGRDVYARDGVWAVPGKKIAIVVGEGKAEAAARRADKYLDGLRAKGASCVAVPSGAAAIAAGAWLTVVGWEVLAAYATDGEAPWILQHPWQVVLYDEAHLGKGASSKRTRAAHMIARSAHRRGAKVWSMTATPVPDRLRDLWAQWWAVAPEAADRMWRWWKRYCDAKRGPYGWDTTGRSHVEELQERLRHWFLVRTRDEIRHLLPSKTRNIVRVPLTDEGDEDGEGVRAFKRRDIRGIEARIAQAASRKLASGVDRIVEALIGGEKVVVVGNRHAWVPRCRQAIEKGIRRGPRRLRERLWIQQATGLVEVAERQEIARQFMEADAPALLIATIDAIKASIDLQRTDRLVVMALPYTPGDVVQLEGRVHRIGGDRPVAVDYLVAQGTIDDAIEEVLLSKLATVEEAGAGTEGVAWAGESDAEVIARLVAKLEAGAAAGVAAQEAAA